MNNVLVALTLVTVLGCGLSAGGWRPCARCVDTTPNYNLAGAIGRPPAARRRC